MGEHTQRRYVPLLPAERDRCQASLDGMVAGIHEYRAAGLTDEEIVEEITEIAARLDDGSVPTALAFALLRLAEEPSGGSL